MDKRPLLCCLFFMVSAPCAADTSTVIVLENGIKVTIVESEFREEEHAIDRCLQKSGRICSIDGNIPFGVVYDPPKTYVKSITALVNGNTYSLDVSNMYNAWSGHDKMPVDKYLNGACHRSCATTGDLCSFAGIFSHGREAYAAGWTIGHGEESIRKTITSSRDIINELLGRHPEYE